MGKLKAKDCGGAIIRYVKENEETYFIFMKGSSKYGHRVDKEYFEKAYTPIKTDKGKEWEKRVDRVIKTLEKSGLWENVLEMFKNLKTLGYEKRNQIYKKYFDIKQFDYITDEQGYRIQRETQEYKDFINKLKQQYPYLVRGGITGEELNTEYFYDLSECKLKNMYFGKWCNKDIKEQIRKSLQEHKDYKVKERTNYDVSFEYNSQLQRAWYSEEYKDCGNGHYYLALDNTLALFCEDD